MLRSNDFELAPGTSCTTGFPRITCPTFVGVGRFGGVAPRHNGAAIAARLPEAQLHLYDGGHLIMQQDPATLADVEAFLTD